MARLFSLAYIPTRWSVLSEHHNWACCRITRARHGNSTLCSLCWKVMDGKVSSIRIQDTDILRHSKTRLRIQASVESCKSFGFCGSYNKYT